MQERARLAPQVAKPGDRPLFSVITVVLNDADGLAATARSIIALREVRWEWIVIDGGSTDGTVDVIASHASSIAHWASEPDGGIFDAMNKGLAAAAGEYIVFMNAGDTFRDGRSLSLVESTILRSTQRPAIVFGAVLYRYPSGLEVCRRAERVESCIWHRTPSSHQTMIIRDDLHRSEPFDTKYKVCADYDVLCRIVLREKIFAYVDEPIAVTLHGGTSWSHRHAWQRIREALRIQRSVLRSGRLTVALSVLKRVASILAEQALSFRPGRRDTPPAGLADQPLSPSPPTPSPPGSQRR